MSFSFHVRCHDCDDETVFTAVSPTLALEEAEHAGWTFSPEYGPRVVESGHYRIEGCPTHPYKAQLDFEVTTIECSTCSERLTSEDPDEIEDWEVSHQCEPEIDRRPASKWETEALERRKKTLQKAAVA